MKSDDRQIAFLHADSTVGEGVLALGAQKSMPLPIWDDDADKWTGVLVATDLVSFLLDVVDSVGPSFGPAGDESNDKREREQRLQRQREKWSGEKLRNVVGASRRSSSREATPVSSFLSYDASALDALRVIAHGALSVQIMAPNERDLLAHICQDDAFALIHENLDKFGDVSKRTVKELLGERMGPVISVNEDEMLIEAFRRIRDMGVTGIAVVNYEGKITGVISASDVLLIGADGANNLALYSDCKSFAKFTQACNKQTPYAVVSCDVRATFASLAKKMADHCVHRVFLTQQHQQQQRQQGQQRISEPQEDDESALVGVCSMRDVFSVLLV